jgi:hypothetical protein
MAGLGKGNNEIRLSVALQLPVAAVSERAVLDAT